jgi:hypothetical protein
MLPPTERRHGAYSLWNACRLAFDRAATRMVSDDGERARPGAGGCQPGTVSGHARRLDLAAAGLAYFVPGAPGRGACSSRQTGEVAVLTNALEATDVAVAPGCTRRKALSWPPTLFELNADRPALKAWRLDGPSPIGVQPAAKMSSPTVRGCSSGRSTSIPVQPGSTPKWDS